MKKKLFLVVGSFTISLIFLNLIIFFSTPLINQKNISPKIFRLIPPEHTFFYTNTFKNLKNYDLILGDSFAFGLGDAFYNNEKDYSISHHLFNLSKNNNYITVGLPGGHIKRNYENFLISQKKLKNKPNKIIYLFYEGNDLEGQILYEKNKHSLKKKITPYIRYYFPLIHITEKSLNKIKYRLFKNKKKILDNTIVKNTFKLKENIMVTAETFQSPPIELTKKETEHTLNVFFDFMLKLQKYCNELIVVYIPSQTSSMNVGEIVYFRKYFPERSIKKSSKKNLDNLHNILVKKISDYSEKNRIIFLDTTKELREVGFNQNIWGIIDTQHLNKLGYKIIARKIYNDLYN